MAQAVGGNWLAGCPCHCGAYRRPYPDGVNDVQHTTAPTADRQSPASSGLCSPTTRYAPRRRVTRPSIWHTSGGWPHRRCRPVMSRSTRQGRHGCTRITVIPSGQWIYAHSLRNHPVLFHPALDNRLNSEGDNGFARFARCDENVVKRLTHRLGLGRFPGARRC